MIHHRGKTRFPGLWLASLGVAGLIAVSQLLPHPTPSPDSRVPSTTSQEAVSSRFAEPAAVPKEATPSADRVLYVTANAVSVRAAPNGNAAVLAKRLRGATVVAVDNEGDWVGIKLDDGSRGWVSRAYLSSQEPPEVAEVEPLPSASQPPPRPSYNRTTVVAAIIAASIAGYPGNCPCPYNAMRNGRSCGGKSAYRRPGGYAPLCYPQDVTQAMIDDYVSRQR